MAAAVGVAATQSAKPGGSARPYRPSPGLRDAGEPAIFSVWTSILLLGLFAAGVHSTLVGALLLTVYLTWSPWHYTGQNYGIAVMFLRRRKVPVDGVAKRLLYTSFILSYVLVFCTFHGAVGGAISYDRFTFDQAAVSFIPLGLPRTIGGPIFLVAALGYVGSTIAATVVLMRHARFRDLVPTLLLVVS